MARTLRRKIVENLETLGGRRLLAGLATLWARRRTRLDVEMFHDEFWIVRVGDSFLPLGERFSLYAWDVDRLRLKRVEALREPLDYWTYCYEPKPTDVVFDIGAGIGTDALVFSDLVGAQGRVYAFEAHPRTFRRLQKTCKWNQLANVEPLPLAVWSGRATLQISDGDEDVANSVLAGTRGGGSVPVEAIDLDAFVRERGIDRIDLLKMNIEGAERMAIRGMESSIKLTRNIVIACHDFLGAGGAPDAATRADVEKFLNGNGFETLSRPEDPRPYVRDHVFGRRR